MPKKPQNSGRRWSAGDRSQLRKLASQNTPTRIIGLKMGRSADAVQSQASKQGTSLKPTNLSPYNRRSK